MCRRASPMPPLPVILLFVRLRFFFHLLFGPTPLAGAGCSSVSYTFIINAKTKVLLVYWPMRNLYGVIAAGANRTHAHMLTHLISILCHRETTRTAKNFISFLRRVLPRKRIVFMYFCTFCGAPFHPIGPYGVRGHKTYLHRFAIFFFSCFPLNWMHTKRTWTASAMSLSRKHPFVFFRVSFLFASLFALKKKKKTSNVQQGETKSNLNDNICYMNANALLWYYYENVWKKNWHWMDSVENPFAVSHTYTFGMDVTQLFVLNGERDSLTMTIQPHLLL